MIKNLMLATALAFLPLQSAAFAQASETPPMSVERLEEVSALPVDTRGGKLRLEAAVNGQSAEFVFDTGSPTILTNAYADQIGLVPVRQNTGRDANGRPITMDVAIAEEIQLGDLVLRNVPVLIHDFEGVPLGSCFFDAGLIGSEILKGSAWRFDMDASEIQVASSATALGVDADTPSAELFDFGYPHAPVLPYTIGKFSDRALFDTGNAGNLVLFKPITDDRAVKQATVRKSVERGKGSEGVSGGGLGQLTDLMRLQLKSMTVGDVSFQSVGAQIRHAPPSLLGMGLLSNHVVTLDYPGGKVWFERRETPKTATTPASFGFTALDERVEVTQIYPEALARGLKLGDRVLAVDGDELAYGDEAEKCATAQWIWNELDASSIGTLLVEREGEEVTIRFDR